MRKDEFPLIEAYADSKVNEVLDKIRAEIDREEKWLAQAGYNAYNVDIAFSSIRHILQIIDKHKAEGEVENGNEH